MALVDILNTDIKPGDNLLLVAGSLPDDEKLAQAMQRELAEQYRLSNVALLKSRKVDDEIKKMDRETWPVTYGPFTDSEITFEAGARTVRDIFDEKHIVYVKHFLTPLAGTSVQDNLFETRVFGSWLDDRQKEGLVKVGKLTLASPYLPYVRNHSIKKYKEMGYLQANTLKLFVDMLASSRFNEVISIDTHSNQIWRELEDRKIYGQHINPFKAASKKDWRLYQAYIEGCNTPEERIEKLEELTPFVQIYKKLIEEDPNIAVAEVDIGTYDRVLEFCNDTGIGLENIISFDKIRKGEGDSMLAGIRWYSQLKKEHIKDRTFLLPDDLLSSGGTIHNVAKYLKENGAKAVYAFISHNAGTKQDKIKNSEFVDKVIMLDTVPNEHHDKFEYLEKKSVLLSMASYKSHMNFYHGARQ